MDILYLTVDMLQAVSDSADTSHDVTPSKSSSKVSDVFIRVYAICTK